MEEHGSVSGGLTFGSLLQLVLIVLKFCGVIKASWLVVLIPIEVEVTLALVMIVIMVIARKFSTSDEKEEKRNERSN